ncbi:MAG: hypothetical protein K6D02_06630 [Lachnospiraceae bacterium]|nr:hypothetical protein [Lachnospiraceae bacterium]
MLGKIIKYDFKNHFKMFITIYLCVIAATLFACGLSGINRLLLDKDIQVLNITIGLLTGIIIVAAIALNVLTFLIVIYNFYKSMVTNEGYLTNTLPVTKTELVIGKNIVGFIMCIISILVSFGCLLLYSVCSTSPIMKSFFESLKNAFKSFNMIIDENGFSFIAFPLILFIATAFIQLYGNITYGYLCVSLGQIMNKNKLLWTIIFAVGINFILQTVSSFLVAILSTLFININRDLDLAVMVQNNSLMPFNIMFIISFVLDLILAMVFSIATIKILDKKLNLE